MLLRGAAHGRNLRTVITPVTHIALAVFGYLDHHPRQIGGEQRVCLYSLPDHGL